jgi:hypothetical protein
MSIIAEEICIITSYKISLVLISFGVKPLLAKYVLSLFLSSNICFYFSSIRSISAQASPLKVYQNLE